MGTNSAYADHAATSEAFRSGSALFDHTNLFKYLDVFTMTQFGLMPSFYHDNYDLIQSIYS